MHRQAEKMARMAALADNHGVYAHNFARSQWADKVSNLRTLNLNLGTLNAKPYTLTNLSTLTPQRKAWAAY